MKKNLISTILYTLIVAFLGVISYNTYLFYKTPNLETKPFGEHSLIQELPGDFSFVVLPDTQFYTEKFPDVFMSQMDWIKDTYQELNTKAVITLGDITQRYDQEEIEWKRANKAYAILDEIRIPYNVLPGNHDISKNGGETNFYNQYFPPERFEDRTWYQGNYDGTNRNNYILINAEGVRFVLVSLEYCPPDGAVEWAREIFAKHTDRIGILATHAYLNEQGVQSRECKRSTRVGDNAGVDLFQKIVKPSQNVQIVMNGHFHHEQGGRYLATNLEGRTVHQILSNYQTFKNGGNGFLRIMSFDQENNLVRVRAFSPYTEEFLTDQTNVFEFEISGLSPQE